MGFWNQTIATVIDLVLKAIGSRCPDLVSAGHYAGFCGLSFVGTDEPGHRGTMTASSAPIPPKH